MGLRGDPILWQMMVDEMAKHSLPDDHQELRQIFGACFRDLTGHDLETAPDHLRVDATDRPNGGMSRGIISGLFWSEKALPLVLARFDATQS